MDKKDEVMCKVGTINYSVNGQCGGGRDSGGKWKEKEERNQKRRRKIGASERKVEQELVFVQNGRGS
jgi:hypothetical protein